MKRSAVLGMGLVAVGLVGTSVATAQIIAISSNVILNGVNDISHYAAASDTHVHAIDEGCRPLYADMDLNEVTLRAPVVTHIECHIVHRQVYHPHDTPSSATATLRFDNPILGTITDSSHLYATDSIFRCGGAGITYPGYTLEGEFAEPERGLEGADSFSIHGDNHGIDIVLDGQTSDNGNGSDQIRVVTCCGDC